MTHAHHADVVIVGSGMGGGTLAWALRDCGARVLLLERGGFLPSEPQNWSAAAVFGENRYKTKEKWRGADGGWYSADHLRCQEPAERSATGQSARVAVGGPHLERFATAARPIAAGGKTRRNLKPVDSRTHGPTEGRPLLPARLGIRRV